MSGLSPGTKPDGQDFGTERMVYCCPEAYKALTDTVNKGPNLSRCICIITTVDNSWLRGP